MAALLPAAPTTVAEITATPGSSITTTTTTTVNITTTPPATSTVKPTAALPTITLQRAGADPPKNLRGLNKPKCIKCGNVARSRCPYQSCKSCCSKAQNPCHIHVLKPNATLADRSSPSNSSILPDQQQKNEAPSSSGPSHHKTASLRQLSSNFAQFNNVHIPLRPSRKPLTRKEAAAINEWRFSKLKEYKERNIEWETEAFDRYMQNISLLEEVFDVSPEVEDDDKTGWGVSGMKAKMRSNPVRIDRIRKRIGHIVDSGFRKLQKNDFKPGDNSGSAEGAEEINQTPKMAAGKDDWAAKASAIYELNEKLNKARNDEDMNTCLQMISQVISNRNNQKSEAPLTKNDFATEQGSEYSLGKLVKKHEIDHDTLNAMDVYFSSLEEIEDL